MQVLYDNFPNDAALKLTIAKYLTPGDLSIQEVGITPDIELIPTRVTKDRIDVFAERGADARALAARFRLPARALRVHEIERLPVKSSGKVDYAALGDG